MTPEEVQQFKEKSASYSSVSHYIRSALAEYSNIGTNELAVAGLLAPSYIQEVLLPVIIETQETLNRIKKDLDSLTQKAVRI